MHLTPPSHHNGAPSQADGPLVEAAPLSSNAASAAPDVRPIASGSAVGPSTPPHALDDGAAAHHKSTRISARFPASPDSTLAAAKQRLELAAECAGLGVFDWHTGDNRLLWDDQMLRIFGVSRESFTGHYRDFERAIHPDDHDRVAAAVDDAVRSGQDFVCEYRVVHPPSDTHPNGRVRHIAARGRLHTTEDGRASRMIGVCTDITDRVHAEADHRRHENLMRATELMAGIGSWEFHLPDPDPLLSEQTLRVFGLPPTADPDLDTILSYYHSEYRPLIRKQLKALLERGEQLSFEARLRTAQGRDVWVRALGRAELDHTGAVTRVFGSFQEITEQKETERRLREQTMVEKLLFRELDHRVRNNLASLASLVEITRQHARDVDHFAEAVERRIHAVAKVHSMLSEAHYEAVPLRTIVSTMAAVADPDRVLCEGDDILIPSRQVTALAMVIAELVNNSLKYGALSVHSGNVIVCWRRDGDDDTIAVFFRESGGPHIEGPVTPGTGCELIEGLAHAELRGDVRFDFPPDGARHRLTVRLDDRPASPR